MFLQQKKPQRGLFTFFCEGNNNPKSPFFSRRVRLSHRQTVVLGRGYDLGDLDRIEVSKTLMSIGLPKRKAEFIATGARLEGKEASKFVEQFENDITLSEDQEIQLFHNKYYKTEEELLLFIEKSFKRYGFIHYERIPVHQQELLIDFMYAGDWNTRIQDTLLMALKKSLDHRKPRIFDLVLMDIRFWTSLGIPEDRVKLRCIYANEWENFQQMHQYSNMGMPDEAFIELLYQSPNLFSIEGFYVDRRFDEFSMVLTKKAPLSHASPKDREETMNTSLEDIVVCAKIFFDKTITNKLIGASLQPYDLLACDIDHIRPEWYPDHYQSKSILKETQFGEALIEAALIVAQLSSGCVYNNKGTHFERGDEFVIPPEIREIGIQPLSEIARPTPKAPTKAEIKPEHVKSKLRSSLTKKKIQLLDILSPHTKTYDLTEKGRLSTEPNKINISFSSQVKKLIFGCNN